MSQANAVFRFVLGMLVAALVLTGCGDGVQIPSGTDKADLSAVYTLSHADQEVKAASASELQIPWDATLQLTEAGAYRVSGRQQGQICIDVQDQIVHLILENLELHSNNGPAIYVRSAAKVVLTVPEGTESTLSDSAYYSRFPEAEGCVFSASDLTINGSGSLNVNSYFEDAIRTKDFLKILDTTLTIRSKGDGLRGNDGVILQNADVRIQCEAIGIHATRMNKPGRGFAAISGGGLNIIAGERGVSVSENFYLQDGSAEIYGVIEDISVQGERHIQEGCLA